MSKDIQESIVSEQQILSSTLSRREVRVMLKYRKLRNITVVLKMSVFRHDSIYYIVLAFLVMCLVVLLLISACIAYFVTSVALTPSNLSREAIDNISLVCSIVYVILVVVVSNALYGRLLDKE